MTARRLLLSVLFLFAATRVRADIPDLNDWTDDFVLETKQIRLPEYPHAFNPSIIRWQGRLLLCFRVIPNPKYSFTSFLGLVWLDEDFNPCSAPQLLETADPLSIVPSRAEDGRLVAIGDRLWLVYSDNKDSIISKGGFRVYLAEVLHNGEKFFLRGIERLSRFEGQSQDKREKNWTPFDYQGKMLLAYSYAPHLIFRPIIGTRECETVACTHSDICWEWGELRGGTTGLRIDDDHYLAFFHSSVDMASVQSKEKTTAHYFMGAYLYTTEVPFAITHVSPRPIIGPAFYDGNVYKPYWKQVNVVFPGGHVFDDDFVWVVFGKHDHELWVTKLDRRGLLDSLRTTDVISVGTK